MVCNASISLMVAVTRMGMFLIGGSEGPKQIVRQYVARSYCRSGKNRLVSKTGSRQSNVVIENRVSLFISRRLMLYRKPHLLAKEFNGG